MSALGDFYSNIYSKLCGVHPHLYVWHFQWLSTKDIYADLRQILPTVKGLLLDVGCGQQPYKNWLNLDEAKYIGIDIYPESKADILIVPDEAWPIDSCSVDVVLCTQVLEHTATLSKTIEEITRVLKPAGLVILTVPFIYNQHGAPEDYRRFSIWGVRNLFDKQYNLVEVKPQGGIGSTVCTLLLNWVELSMNSYKGTRLLKGLFMPIWILFCSFINIIGWLLDQVDKTNSFYSNVFLVAQKR